MNKSQSMSQLFEKLNDLKSIFEFGQRIVPVIQNLIDFMGEIVPLLENINKSILESTSKIPGAQNQINNVTSATELATTEILDLVDRISNSLDTGERKLKDCLLKQVKRNEIVHKLRESFKGHPEIEHLFDEYVRLSYENEMKEVVEDLISQMKNDTFNITLSLQVQDITSQQLAAVNHLITSVQQRLDSLIVDLEETEIQEIKKPQIVLQSGQSFDANAEYTKDNKKQIIADQTVLEHQEKASQDEIDKLFQTRGNKINGK